MSTALIIAEKPSVASDLQRVLTKELGKFEKKGKDRNTWFENDNAVICSAVGHLVQLKMPEGPNGKKLPWGMGHLPAIPDKFELQPIEKSESRLKLLHRLLKRKDVTRVINACDAGREGELIFRYVMQLSGIDKPVQRMWMQSMTNSAILDAYQELREDEQMMPLADAAMCRSESDWLVGLNGTRALTAFNSRHGGFNVTSAGRVQTPTLAILAKREWEIRKFVSRDYWEVHADFSVSAGQYEARWFKEDFKKDETDAHARAERLWSEDEAQAILDRCAGKTGVVEETRKPSKESPPPLFDLTSLQREASSRFGFSARNTLSIAQALYEKHKLLTYPRTDSKFLPEDYISTIKSNLTDFSKAKPSDALSGVALEAAGKVIAQNWIKPNKRIFNNAKISDHFAIVPTGKIPTSALKEQEQKIFDLVTRRLIAIFFPPAEYENTTRITRVGEDAFLTRGKVLVTSGYLEVYGRKPGGAAEKDELVVAKDGESAEFAELESIKKETRPPARYTEATLLSAMETAGKLVDDETLRDAMSERGLGTPATRAQIIEGLISSKYLFRHELQKRDLVVSNKGLALIEDLNKIGIDELRSPELTGNWEYKLKQIESGVLSRDDFMEGIKLLTRDIVAKTQARIDEEESIVYDDIKATCPLCETSTFKQTSSTYSCKNPECKFKLNKHIASHLLTPEQASELLKTKRIGPFDDFKNRFGQPFEADLTLIKTARTWKVDFRSEADDLREAEAKNLTEDQLLCMVEREGQESLKVYETSTAYLSPDMAADKQSGGTRIAKTILQNDITPEQARKLFAEGKTDVIEGFISRKTKRPFSAFLLLDSKTGKLSFEFPPRPASKKKAKGKKKSTAKKAAAKKKATAKAAAKKVAGAAAKSDSDD